MSSEDIVCVCVCVLGVGMELEIECYRESAMVGFEREGRWELVKTEKGKMKEIGNWRI